jgi:hypothetical protein
MAFVFVLGVVLGIVAVLLRRYGRASGMTLAGGASVLAILAVAGLVHTDAREGLATLGANRRQYLFVLASELPVLVLALVSLERRKKLFWLGWGIHTAFTSCVVAVVIWLEFFWHW